MNTSFSFRNFFKDIAKRWRYLVALCLFSFGVCVPFALGSSTKYKSESALTITSDVSKFPYYDFGNYLLSENFATTCSEYVDLYPELAKYKQKIDKDYFLANIDFTLT